MNTLVIVEVDSEVIGDATKIVRDIALELIVSYARDTGGIVTYKGWNGIDAEHGHLHNDKNYIEEMASKTEDIMRNIANALYYKDSDAYINAYLISYDRHDTARELTYIQRYSKWSDETRSNKYTVRITEKDSYEDKVKFYEKVLKIRHLYNDVIDIFSDELEKLKASKEFIDTEEEANEVCVNIPKELDEINNLLNKLAKHIENISGKLSNQNNEEDKSN